jgi:hypothetical protein
MPEIPAAALLQEQWSRYDLRVISLRKPQPDMDLYLSDIPMAKRPHYLETGYQGFRLVGGAAELCCCPHSRKWPVRKMSRRQRYPFPRSLGRSILAMRRQPAIVGLATVEDSYDTACLKSEPSIYRSVFDFLAHYTSDYCSGLCWIGRDTSINPV